MKDALADLPIYVINLNTPKYRVKREFMQKQLDDLGLAFEFLDATDDRQTLTAEEIDLLGGKEMLFKYVNNPDTPQGSVGCIISHFRCYKKLLTSSHPYCLILEDDAVLLADSLVVLRNLLQQEKEWNLIRLGYIIPSTRDQLFFGKSTFPLNFLACRRLALDSGLVNPRSYYFGALAFDIKNTHAYLISREGAKLALNNWTASIQHLDITMNLAPLPHQFAVMPSISHQEDTLAESATGWDGKYIPFRPSGMDLPSQIKNKSTIIRSPDSAPPPAGTNQWKKVSRKIGWWYYKIASTWKVLFVRKTGKAP